ncbi:hypothetical protein [Kitasatospora sp. NPDC092286]|uniref:hypothetical protein n=1 Tax=Kitasatospora sp. NPDC092286 TaxID=3364087 RepID=UPI00382047F9
MTDETGETDKSQLLEEYNLAHSGLMGGMHGISDAFRELGSGTGRGFGPMARFRENHLNTGRPVAELAQELADWAADLAEEATAYDAKRHKLEELGILPLPR